MLSNTSINVQQDRLYHRVLGHAHSSSQLSSLVSLRECVVPRGDTPLCRPNATWSRSTHALESCARLGIHGAVRGPHLEWQGFLRMLSTPQMTREGGV